MLLLYLVTKKVQPGNLAVEDHTLEDLSYYSFGELLCPVWDTLGIPSSREDMIYSGCLSSQGGIRISKLQAP